MYTDHRRFGTRVRGDVPQRIAKSPDVAGAVRRIVLPAVNKNGDDRRSGLSRGLRLRDCVPCVIELASAVKLAEIVEFDEAECAALLPLFAFVQHGEIFDGIAGLPLMWVLR